MLKTKRIDAPAEPGDGTRFLVDRLWPRGINKEELEMQSGGMATHPRATKQGDVTLLYSARDTEHINAVLLKGFLEEQM